MFIYKKDRKQIGCCRPPALLRSDNGVGEKSRFLTFPSLTFHLCNNILFIYYLCWTPIFISNQLSSVSSHFVLMLFLTKTLVFFHLPNFFFRFFSPFLYIYLYIYRHTRRGYKTKWKILSFFFLLALHEHSIYISCLKPR